MARRLTATLALSALLLSVPVTASAQTLPQAPVATVSGSGGSFAA